MAKYGFLKDGGDEILSEINVVPLVDISLVLMLIFMVTANYLVTSSFSVDIAQASHAKAVQQTDLVTVSLSREGPMYLNDELVTSKEFKKRMQEKFTKNPQVAVMLSADKNADFKNVVAILDCLSEIGITGLNIAAKTDAN